MMAAANEETFGSNYPFQLDIQNREEDNAFVVVYFDLETSGFSCYAEILQIAAMYGDCSFSVYINPQFGIPLRVSEVNGLTEYQGTLLLNGSPVSSVSLQAGLMQFHSFLNSAGKRCILTAHNCRFDRSHLINAIESLDLMEEFKHLIYGFSDTLPIAQGITGSKEKGVNTLGGLANYLQLPYTEAHNAIVDVEILIQILRGLNVSDEHIIAKCESLDAIIKLKRRNEHIALLLEKLGPIQYVVSRPLRIRIVCANITYEMMEKAYIKDKELGLANLLSEVTKTKNVISKLTNYLELYGNF